MSLAGTWNVSMNTPMGKMQGVFTFVENEDGSWGGTNTAMNSTNDWDSVSVDGNEFKTEFTMNSPMGKMSGTVNGVLDEATDTISGQNVTSMGAAEFTGTRG